MSLIPFTPFLLPTSYFLRPAAPAEIAPKNVLRLIAGKICCRYQLSTPTCSPRDEPAVVGRAVALEKEEHSTIYWALISFSDLRIRWEWHPLRNDPRFSRAVDQNVSC